MVIKIPNFKNCLHRNTLQLYYNYNKIYKNKDKQKYTSKSFAERHLDANCLIVSKM